MFQLTGQVDAGLGVILGLPGGRTAQIVPAAVPALPFQLSSLAAFGPALRNQIYVAPAQAAPSSICLEIFAMKLIERCPLLSPSRLRFDVSIRTSSSRFAVPGLIAVFALVGCGDGGSERTEPGASTAAAPPAVEQAPAVSYKATRLQAEQLHDIELPEVGHFRLLVDGQLFTGPFGSPSTCRLGTEYGSSPFHTKEFVFSASLPIDRTSYKHISVIRRLVSEEGDWTVLWPHESDEVEVSMNLREGRPSSRQWVRRVQPGGESFRFDADLSGYNAGPHELPVIRVRQDEHIVVTAVGELHPRTDHPDLPTGPFELAAVCP